MKRAFTLILATLMVLGCFCGGVFAEEEDSFGLGDAENNTYWNETMSIGCTLDENWYFYTREEILELSGMTAEMLDDTLAEVVKDAGAMMDMYAMNQVTGASVNVNLERLSIANSLLISETSYINLSEEGLITALEQMGCENVQVESGTMEFLGKEHACARVSTVISGLQMYETIVVVKTGRTMIVVTSASYLEDTTEEVLSCFFDKPEA